MSTLQATIQIFGIYAGDGTILPAMIALYALEQGMVSFSDIISSCIFTTSEESEAQGGANMNQALIELGYCPDS